MDSGFIKVSGLSKSPDIEKLAAIKAESFPPERIFPNKGITDIKVLIP